MLNLTLLTENKVRKNNLLAEHGLSIWIEFNGNHYLFDAGQSDVYLTNARKLGIDVTRADQVILSHGHYDHGGGLTYFPTREKTRLIAHPAAFDRKISLRDNNQHVYTGLPDDVQQWPDIVYNNGMHKLAEAVWAVTEIKTISDFKPCTDNMYIQDNGKIYPDNMLDEQILVIEREYGLVVILGCSHPGVINCLLHVKNKFPGQQINTVIGGMHLQSKEDNELDDIIKALKDMSITRLIPLHCTGLEASCLMKARLGSSVFFYQTGDQIVLD